MIIKPEIAYLIGVLITLLIMSPEIISGSKNKIKQKIK